MKYEMVKFLDALAGAVMIAGMIAIYCWVTPAQSSAEAEWFEHQCEEAGK